MNMNFEQITAVLHPLPREWNKRDVEKFLQEADMDEILDTIGISYTGSVPLVVGDWEKISGMWHLHINRDE